jgi:hypothetical protein
MTPISQNGIFGCSSMPALYQRGGDPSEEFWKGVEASRMRGVRNRSPPVMVPRGRSDVPVPIQADCWLGSEN